MQKKFIFGLAIGKICLLFIRSLQNMQATKTGRKPRIGKTSLTDFFNIGVIGPWIYKTHYWLSSRTISFTLRRSAWNLQITWTEMKYWTRRIELYTSALLALLYKKQTNKQKKKLIFTVSWAQHFLNQIIMRLAENFNLLKKWDFKHTSTLLADSYEYSSKTLRKHPYSNM